MKLFSLGAVCLFISTMAHADGIEFWNQQRAGTNLFNEVETIDRLTAAKSIGVQVVRLTFTKWKTNIPGGAQGTFLLGNLDHYEGLVPSDLQQLIATLDDAHRVGLKVVITPLSLFGNRWRQHNGNRNDLRIWSSDAFQNQAAQFWQDLAHALKGHPALVGYDIKNEPDVELASPRFEDWHGGDYQAWCGQVAGTTSDLSLFYEKVIGAVRQVDSEVPIVVETGFYATPWGFKCLRKINDDKVIYSFHMYEPYSFTYYGNRGRYTYPGNAPIGEGEYPPTVLWNRVELRKFLQPIVDWTARNEVPPTRIFVGEFGVYRQAPGASTYLQDLVDIFNSLAWHWAFYSFREDWAGMNYELGAEPLPESYWEAVDRGENPDLKPFYHSNSLFDVLLSGLAWVVRRN